MKDSIFLAFRKSSIFSLLLRFYDPDEGRILLDGRDLKTYNPLWLRQNLAVVSQDLALVRRTVKENLLYGIEEELDEDPAGSFIHTQETVIKEWEFMTSEM